jgi:hypothetical protein
MKQKAILADSISRIRIQISKFLRVSDFAS